MQILYIVMAGPDEWDTIPLAAYDTLEKAQARIVYEEACDEERVSKDTSEYRGIHYRSFDIRTCEYPED